MKPYVDVAVCRLRLSRATPQICGLLSVAQQAQFAWPTALGTGTNNNQRMITGTFVKSWKYKRNCARWKAGTTAVTHYLTKGTMLLHLVEKSYFKEMTEILDRQYQLPTQKYFTKMAFPNTYKVREELGGLSVFFLTNNRYVVQCWNDTIHSDSALYFTWVDSPSGSKPPFSPHSHQFGWSDHRWEWKLRENNWLASQLTRQPTKGLPLSTFWGGHGLNALATIFIWGLQIPSRFNGHDLTVQWESAEQLSPPLPIAGRRRGSHP